ncbi:hypothetical protein LP7551_03937 [Roseibium album]|nr:hypothetical protein LP7551_03937 [Roseibium album]
MKIAANSTIAASELALLKLADTSVDEPLILPTRIRHLAGGAEAALLQLVVTWAQRCVYRRLETYITSSDDPQIDNFIRKLPGMTAALCAHEISGRAPPTDLTHSVVKAALDRLGKLSGAQPASAFRGPSAEILCADHIARGTPYLLYQKCQTGGSELRSRGNFRSLAAWLLRKSFSAEYRETTNPKLGDALGGMLYEAFKNTEDHARVDERGDVLETSIRAIKTNRFDIEPDVLVRILKDFSPLAEYCRSLVPLEGGVQTHFFELSIVDSGPGFASTWTSKSINELSIFEEETAVRECFARGSAKQRNRFGEGLPHVLRILEQEQGFLKLRTGRLSFYVDYSKSDSKSKNEVLQRYRPKEGELAPVSGSLLTIILPLRRRV